MFLKLCLVLLTLIAPLLALEEKKEIFFDPIKITTKKDFTYTLHYVPQGCKFDNEDLKNKIEKEFVQSFCENYKNETLESLGKIVGKKNGGYDNKEDWLKEGAIGTEWKLVDEGKRHLFYALDEKGTVAAFFSFDYDKENKELHPAQGFTSLGYQKKGIIISSIGEVLKIFSEAKIITLETRVCNKISKTLLEALGFKKEGEPRKPYSATYYDGYTITVEELLKKLNTNKE